MLTWAAHTLAPHKNVLHCLPLQEAISCRDWVMADRRERRRLPPPAPPRPSASLPGSAAAPFHERLALRASTGPPADLVALVRGGWYRWRQPAAGCGAALRDWPCRTIQRSAPELRPRPGPCCTGGLHCIACPHVAPAAARLPPVAFHALGIQCRQHRLAPAGACPPRALELPVQRAPAQVGALSAGVFPWRARSPRVQHRQLLPCPDLRSLTLGLGLAAQAMRLQMDEEGSRQAAPPASTPLGVAAETLVVLARLLFASLAPLCLLFFSAWRLRLG